MPYKLRVTVDLDYTGQSGGGDEIGFVGPGLSNNPGYTNAFTAGAVGIAQTMELLVSEQVAGGDTLTLANILTALQNAANDLAGTPPNGGTAIFSQVGGWGGNPSITPLAVAQAWPTAGD